MPEWKLVYVETEDEMLAAISERTAMIAGLTMVEKSKQPGIIPLERLVAIGKHAGVPVYLDASFSLDQVPDASVLWRYTQMGADLVGISGGKGLHAPQSSGILGRARRSHRCRQGPGVAERGGFWPRHEGRQGGGHWIIGGAGTVPGSRSSGVHRRDLKRVETMREYLRDIPGLAAWV